MSGTENNTTPFAVVTGGSSGIGLALAKQFCAHGFDVLIAADEHVQDAVAELRAARGHGMVQGVTLDLATEAGIDGLYEAITVSGRPVDALAANAGIGIGQGFLDQTPEEWRKMVETNITGTIDLIHRVGRDMRARQAGRILITSSIASQTPSPFLAIYSATKAFLESFGTALRSELAEHGVSVTTLLPGATDSEIWERGGVTYTKLGAMPNKDDPDAVAKSGFDALMAGDGHVIHGLKNKLAVAAAKLLPDGVVAAVARRTTEPGSAED